jgi:hypothetical protein
MKKNELKDLIKEMVNEMRSGFSNGEQDFEDIEVDGQTVGNIITPEHTLKFTVRVTYDADAGESAKGMFGPPEHSSPGSESSAELIDAHMIHLEVMAPGSNDYVEMNLQNLKQKYPQIYQQFHKIAYEYVSSHWREFEDKILDDLNAGSGTDEPDRDQ